MMVGGGLSSATCGLTEHPSKEKDGTKGTKGSLRVSTSNIQAVE